MAEKVKIMVVDDTSTYRRILSRIVTSIETAELVGAVSSGNEAISGLPGMSPDLVVLDIMMPDMDGFETVKELKRIRPNLQIVMISGADLENADLTFKSLQHGALDFIPKPTALNMKEGLDEIRASLEPLIEVVFNQMNNKSVVPPIIIESKPATSTERSKLIPDIDLVLIGVSTGGPDALFKVFPEIKKNIGCPILIVQHMPPLFTQSLAENLNERTSLYVIEASDGMIARKGQVIIAPGGVHMTVEMTSSGRMMIKLLDTPPVNHCKPSIDVLFNSVAALKTVRCLCVIMTGMGRDGTEGVRRLKQETSYCLIQDQTTSVVWGMPGSVYEAGLHDEILPVNQLGSRIQEIVGSR